MGAAKRWSSLHSGTTFSPSKVTARGDDRECALTLNTPPRLFSDSFLGTRLGVAVEVALQASGGKGGRVDVSNLDDETVRFAVSWKG